jgi:hypothetical protein
LNIHLNVIFGLKHVLKFGIFLLWLIKIYSIKILGYKIGNFNYINNIDFFRISVILEYKIGNFNYLRFLKLNPL